MVDSTLVRTARGAAETLRLARSIRFVAFVAGSSRLLAMVAPRGRSRPAKRRFVDDVAYDAGVDRDTEPAVESPRAARVHLRRR